MIWIITTATLYLLIAAAGLFLICSNEEGEARTNAYYDVRNIAVAMFWPIVLAWAGLVGLAHLITRKPQAKEPAE